MARRFPVTWTDGAGNLLVNAVVDYKLVWTRSYLARLVQKRGAGFSLKTENSARKGCPAKKAGVKRGGELSNARPFVAAVRITVRTVSPVSGRSNQPGRCQSLAPTRIDADEFKIIHCRKFLEKWPIVSGCFSIARVANTIKLPPLRGAIKIWNIGG